jgi:hypothetical protein
MAITFGDTGAPSNITTYFDTLFAQTLAKYNKTLVDNIGKSNALFHKIINSNMYEGESGGTYIQIPLMYGLGTFGSYEGYDELSTTPTEGITSAIFQWSQLASPIVYSMIDVLKNREKIVDLVKTKMLQAEMTIQEGFMTHFLQGSGTGALTVPKVDVSNGSSSIDPIAKLIEYSTTAETVGNINPTTETWWRNQTKTSAATTYVGLLKEMVNLFNNCSKGAGGRPDLIWMDQESYELFHFAYFNNYRLNDKGSSTEPNFPFEHFKFMGATVAWDEKIPNVFAGTTDTSTVTGGTAYFINSKFFRIKYMNGRDFTMLKDENGKSFAKPINGDSRVGHIAWMGNICVNNRRKLGVLGKIARSLT